MAYNGDVKYVIASNIRKRRREKAITIEELAELTSLNLDFIKSIEGFEPPRIEEDLLQRIAKALDVRVDDLIS